MTAADAGGMPAELRLLPLVEATAENLADYGLLLDEEVHAPSLPIPFYAGTVEEGHNLPFEYRGRAVIRTARISPRGAEVRWIERHLDMTQLFVGLGRSSFVMVLGKPSHELGLTVPRLCDVQAFRFAPGQGVLIHRGTWHDFPMALRRPITVLTANSHEVVDALAKATGATELDTGDVFKIDVKRRLGVRIEVLLPGARRTATRRAPRDR